MFDQLHGVNCDKSTVKCKLHFVCNLCTKNEDIEKQYDARGPRRLLLTFFRFDSIGTTLRETWIEIVSHSEKISRQGRKNILLSHH